MRMHAQVLFFEMSGKQTQDQGFTLCRLCDSVGQGEGLWNKEKNIWKGHIIKLKMQKTGV